MQCCLLFHVIQVQTIKGENIHQCKQNSHMQCHIAMGVTTTGKRIAGCTRATSAEKQESEEHRGLEVGKAITEVGSTHLRAQSSEHASEICTSRFTKCCVCHEICSSRFKSAVPATKSALRGSESTAPAIKSALPSSQSPAPATKSALRRSQSTAPATKSKLRGSQSIAPATKSALRGSQSPVPAAKSAKYCTCKISK